MNILVDFLLKGVIGGAGQVVATSVSKICGFALTDKVIGKLIIGLARTLAKRTNIANNLYSAFKKANAPS